MYHRDPHIESTAALKVALAYRGIIPNTTVRSPLMPVPAAGIAEIESALQHAGIERGFGSRQADRKAPAGLRT